MGIRLGKVLARAAASGVLAGVAIGCGGGAQGLEAPSAGGEEKVDGAGRGAKGNEAEAAAKPTPAMTEPVPAACCRGKNACRGKGFCAVEGKHDCRGRNACRGQGGCRSPECG